MAKSSKTEYELNLSGFSGGLNLRDADYCLGSSESPQLQNMLWRNGFLASRKGQEYLANPAGTLGSGHALYQGVWHGYLFAHIGTKLYAINQGSGAYIHLCNVPQEIPGTFFMYGGALYYKSYAIYKKITATESGGLWSFTCTDVTAFVPVIVMNAGYADGSGDLYQPENRYSPLKTVWFNASAGITKFFLPVKPDYIDCVIVDGVRKYSGWTFNATEGSVTFSTAPPVTDPPTNNTVRITYSKTNINAYNSVNFARYATTYGGTGELCVVVAGSSLLPNAYFWSGNSDVAMDPGYFPMEQYQIAGETENPITGFGKQQSNLIIFQETAIGKASLGVVEIDGRNSIEMPYTPINAKIGCKYPWSIQLVENNLVWTNSNGIYTLLDTTEANENFIRLISEKVNGRRGYYNTLFFDLDESSTDTVCAIDDGQRYWLLCNEHAWVWDYRLSTYSNPSWFFLTGINGISLACDESDVYQLDDDGNIIEFQDEFDDFGSGFDRIFRTPAFTFGELNCLKNVNSVIVSMSAENETDTEITYISDYSTRTDMTNLQVVDGGGHLSDPSVRTGATSPQGEALGTPGTRTVSNINMAVFRRRPMCRRVIHFSLKLENENTDDVVVFYVAAGLLAYDDEYRAQLFRNEYNIRKNSLLEPVWLEPQAIINRYMGEE